MESNSRRTRILKIRILFFFLMLLQAGGAPAQTPAVMEQRLLQVHRQVSEGSNAAAADSFAHLLRQVAAAESSLGHPFAELRRQPGMHIADAPDGRLRIYSWDDGSGGTMRFQRNLFQYRDARGAVRVQLLPRAEADAGYFYSGLFLLSAGPEPLYLARRHGIYSSKDCHEGVQCLRVTTKGIDFSVKAIRTGTGLRNGIGFSYDFFSVVDRPERPITLIHWDANSATLTLPVVRENGAVTRQHIRYYFDGTELRRLKR